jgi:hypothetical protein
LGKKTTTFLLFSLDENRFPCNIASLVLICLLASKNKSNFYSMTQPFRLVRKTINSS